MCVARTTPFVLQASVPTSSSVPLKWTPEHKRRADGHGEGAGGVAAVFLSGLITGPFVPVLNPSSMCDRQESAIHKLN